MTTSALLTFPVSAIVTAPRDLRELACQIRAHILADCEDARLRELGANIIAHFRVSPRQPRQLARAFQLFSQQQIKYFREYPEINAAPWVTAKWKIGDCDDKSRLIAALLKNFRIPVRLRFATFDTGKRRVSHVWPEAELDGRWEALESVRNWPLGKNPIDSIRARGWKHSTFALLI